MRIREIIIVFCLVLSLAFIGVISVFSAIVDSTDNTNEAIVSRDASPEETLGYILAEGLSGSEDGVITLCLDEYDINELLYSARGTLSVSPLTVRSIYIEQVGSEHRIFLPVRLLGIDTLLSGRLTLSEDKGDIIVGLADIAVGSLGIDSGIISMLNLKGVIINALSGLGIGAYFEGETLTAKIDRESIGVMLLASLDGNPNAGLIMSMYSLLMLRSDAVDIDINSPTDIKVRVDLTVFGGKSDGDFLGVNEYTEKLLEESKIDRGHIGLVSKYYVNGYDRLNDEERAAISEILSDTADFDSYGGLVERRQLSLVSLLLHQFDFSINVLTGGDYGFKVNDSDINDLLTDLDVYGMVWQFADRDADECGYIAVRQVFSDISDNLITLSVHLDINGYLLPISADFHTGESPLVAISGSLGQIRIGEVLLNESETDGVFSFISSYVNAGWIWTDATDRSLTIDFASVFTDDPTLRIIFAASRSVVTVCRKSALTDGGFMLISLKIF